MPRENAGLSAETLEKLSKAENWSAWKVSPKCIVVTLDRASDLKAGDSVYSPDRMGNGFVFRNNSIHSAGRVLVKAGGLVEHNYLTTPHAFVVCPELPGDAAAGIENLTLRQNVFRNGGWFCPAPWSSQAGIISITANATNSELHSKPIFKNIRIENNFVDGGAGPSLVISSAEGVVIQRNQFRDPQHDEPPATGASYHIPNNAVVWVSKSSGVVYEDNAIKNTGPFAGEAVQIQK
jgi:hypothetical protein